VWGLAEGDANAGSSAKGRGGFQELEEVGNFAPIQRRVKSRQRAMIAGLERGMRRNFGVKGDRRTCVSRLIVDNNQVSGDRAKMSNRRNLSI